MRISKILNGLYLSLLLLWGACIYVGWVKLSIEPDFFERHWISFAKFYSVGGIISSKDKKLVYDPTFQRAHLATLVPEKVLPKIEMIEGQPGFPTGFVEHPPHFILMYAPLSFLPMLWAFYASTFLCWLAGVLGLCFLTRTANTLTLRQTSLLVLGTMVSFPNQFDLMLGQPAWLIVGLYSTYMALWFKRCDKLAGLILALATIKPQYPLFFAIPALLKRKWQLLLVAFVVGSVLLLVCVLAVGLPNVLAYVPMIKRLNTLLAFSADDIGMPSLRGVIANFFGITAGMKVGLVFGVLVLPFLGWIWWRTEKAGRDPRWAFAVTLISMMLFSPHIFRYDLVLLAPAAALTLHSVRLFGVPLKEGNDTSTNLAFALWRILLITFPFSSMIIEVIAGSEKIAVLLLVLLNLVLLAASLRLWSVSKDETATLIMPSK